MSRFFIHAEAERLLPKVEEGLREALFVKAEFVDAEKQMRAFNKHLMMAGGAVVDHSRILQLKQTRDSLAATLQQSIERVHDIGCLVKDLDIGLVDFPTLYQGHEVYLCWRLGEESIRFWHGVDEGFAGRKPITEEFLSQHTSSQ